MTYLVTLLKSDENQLNYGLIIDRNFTIVYFEIWLGSNSIEMYGTFNESRAVVVERFKRTLKNRMYRYLTAQNT